MSDRADLFAFLKAKRISVQAAIELLTQARKPPTHAAKKREKAVLPKYATR